NQPRARELVSEERAPAVLRGVDVSADGTCCRGRGSKAALASAGSVPRTHREATNQGGLGGDSGWGSEDAIGVAHGSLLPQANELPASSQALCGLATQLSRPATSLG